MSLEKENLMFNAALHYKEILIYIYQNIKIYKCLYKNTSFYIKIDTKNNSFSFTKDFFNLVQNKEESFELLKEFIPYKLNKKTEISFATLGGKIDFWNRIDNKFHPLLELIFSIPLNGRPRKYFQNSFGKVMISDKKEKLTGHYKKIIETSF